jgi:hypothetical protein
MNKFTLVPFTSEISLPQIELSGWIDRNEELLSIEYHLQGDLNLVTIDPLAIAPSRQPELWQDTCFEFFIGVPGDRNYWEFNLSPSGDWNVFQLDDYRLGLREEAAFSSLPFSVKRQANSLVLRLKFDLSKIISIDSLSERLRQRDLEISVTTVIKSTQDEISYWALTHKGKEADFHLRDSFILKI